MAETSTNEDAAALTTVLVLLLVIGSFLLMAHVAGAIPFFASWSFTERLALICVGRFLLMPGSTASNKKP